MFLGCILGYVALLSDQVLPHSKYFLCVLWPHLGYYLQTHNRDCRMGHYFRGVDL